MVTNKGDFKTIRDLPKFFQVSTEQRRVSSCSE